MRKLKARFVLICCLVSINIKSYGLEYLPKGLDQIPAFLSDNSIEHIVHNIDDVIAFENPKIKEVHWNEIPFAKIQGEVLFESINAGNGLWNCEDVRQNYDAAKIVFAKIQKIAIKIKMTLNRYSSLKSLSNSDKLQLNKMFDSINVLKNKLKILLPDEFQMIDKKIIYQWKIWDNKFEFLQNFELHQISTADGYECSNSNNCLAKIAHFNNKIFIFPDLIKIERYGSPLSICLEKAKLDISGLIEIKTDENLLDCSLSHSVQCLVPDPPAHYRKALVRILLNAATP